MKGVGAQNPAEGVAPDAVQERMPREGSREILVDLFPDATKRSIRRHSCARRRIRRIVAHSCARTVIRHSCARRVDQGGQHALHGVLLVPVLVPVLLPILRFQNFRRCRLPRGDEELAKYAVASPLLDSREDLPASSPERHGHTPRDERAQLAFLVALFRRVVAASPGGPGVEDADERVEGARPISGVVVVVVAVVVPLLREERVPSRRALGFLVDVHRRVTPVRLHMFRFDLRERWRARREGEAEAGTGDAVGVPSGDEIPRMSAAGPRARWGENERAADASKRRTTKP